MRRARCGFRPFAAESAALRASGRPKEKQAAPLDADTIAALTVWGDLR
ncbi:MAG: hypothetical protein WDO74_24940 [Pseudomonadota bacterium]